jgi:hypothetical protein
MSKVHLRTSKGIACGRWTAHCASTSKPSHVTCRACTKTAVYASIAATAAKLTQEGQAA